jgi:hypothetical protein
MVGKCESRYSTKRTRPSRNSGTVHRITCFLAGCALFIRFSNLVSPKECQLLLCFHALGNEPSLKTPGHDDHGRHNCRIAASGAPRGRKTRVTAMEATAMIVPAGRSTR